MLLELITCSKTCVVYMQAIGVCVPLLGRHAFLELLTCDINVVEYNRKMRLSTPPHAYRAGTTLE